jgi:hypothetical protein
VRVILDECVPRPLRRHLPGHEVTTVQERGWAGLKNGPLLRLMREAQIEAFVTSDRNLEYQQNVAAAGFAVLVLVAVTNTLEDLLPLVLAPSCWRSSPPWSIPGRERSLTWVSNAATDG